eukprot:855745-Amphidinium_carterae.1
MWEADQEEWYSRSPSQPLETLEEEEEGKPQPLQEEMSEPVEEYSEPDPLQEESESELQEESEAEPEEEESEQETLEMEGDTHQPASKQVPSPDPYYLNDFQQWQANKLRKLETQQHEIIEQQHVLQDQQAKHQKQLQQQYDQHSEYRQILLQVLERLPPVRKQPNVPEPEETPQEVKARPAPTSRKAAGLHPKAPAQKPLVRKVQPPPMQQSVDPAKASTTRRV